MSSVVLRNICSLPRDLHERGKSPVELANNAGYVAGAIDPTMVEAYIRTRPDLVEEWLNYSADKRGSSAWYFFGESQNAYVVGFYPDGERRSFDDRVAACAYFITKEFDFLTSDSVPRGQ